MLVGEKHLLAANSLFTLTIAVAQILGLMVLGPLSISLLRVEGGFVVVAVLYLIAAISVSTLPKDKPAARVAAAVSAWRQLWADIRESLQFVSGQRRIQAALVQLVTIATMIMVMAMLAPGYAARVFGHVCRRCRHRLCAGRRRHVACDRCHRPVGACFASHRLWLPGADPGRVGLCRHGLDGPRLRPPDAPHLASVPQRRLQPDHRHHGIGLRSGPLPGRRQHPGANTRPAGVAGTTSAAGCSACSLRSAIWSASLPCLPSASWQTPLAYRAPWRSWGWPL